jgi:hypothetical protein
VLVARASPAPAPGPVVEPDIEAFGTDGRGEAGDDPEPLIRRPGDGRIGELATR